MHKIFQLFLMSALVLVGVFAQASPRLVINAVEFGVAKFHRHDNKVHTYGKSNAWSVFILPDNADTKKPMVQKNDDGSFTVFYSTLEEMMVTATQISQKENLPISVLNINGHGLPGAMWFPADNTDLKSNDCSSWVSAANGKDEDNYDQYYSPISKNEIIEMRFYSNNPMFDMGCTSGLPQWTAVAKRHPEFKQALASDLQIHFLSCVVGLGKAGKAFTEGMASLLVGNAGRVETSTFYGLGDWSMPEGMGFWDYVTDDQLNHDNQVYPVDKQDREMMQKGIVRMATYNGGWSSVLVSAQDFMSLQFGPAPTGPIVGESVASASGSRFLNIKSLRVPGTKVSVPVHMK